MSSQNQEVTISKKEYEELLKLKKKKQRKQKKRVVSRKKVKKDLLDRRKKIAEEQLKELANSRAAELRVSSTESEKKFKIYLKLMGIKYSFQYPIYPKKSFFIVDFFLPRERLVIEIDGGYHNDRKQQAKDRHRDKVILEDCGFKTIRIKNGDVEKGEIHIKQLLGIYLNK